MAREEEEKTAVAPLHYVGMACKSIQHGTVESGPTQ